MKVAIVTIVDGANYGNRLQNYALQFVLEELGLEAYTLRMKTSNDRSHLQMLVFTLKNRIKRMLGREYTQINKYYPKRKQRFAAFNTRYIHFAKEILANNQYPKGIDKRYHYFIAGSDQVWNPRTKIVYENLHNHLLQFAQEEQRIAYAASFGTRELPITTRELIGKELSKFSAIGVREQEGKAIVAQLCDRTAEVVLDPTMLLDAEQWDRLAVRPQFAREERFILTYFLGGRSKWMKQSIQRIADVMGCAIIDLENDYTRDDAIENLEHYLATPDEFLWLTAHAQCVFTDSFHGCVFSILYATPFAVFPRVNVETGNQMSGRIETLLSEFGMMERMKELDIPFDAPDPMPKDQISAVLSRKREQSLDFLRKSLRSNT